MRVYAAVVLLLSIAQPVTAQRLRGRVVEDSTRLPVANASVTLHQRNGFSATRVTDTRGDFSFDIGIGDGDTLVVEHPSYQTILHTRGSIGASTFELPEILLHRNPIPVAPVVVRGRTDVELEGFYDRMRRSGGGHFITRSEIEKRSLSHRPSDLLSTVPGLDVRPVRIRGNVTSVRWVWARRGGSRCLPGIFIDGTPVRQVPESGIDDIINLASVAAVEVYAREGTVPARFSQPNNCAVVLFWTRAQPELERRRSRLWVSALGVGAVAIVVLNLCCIGSR